MNPTDPYIKMCIAATEIQKLKFLDEIEDVEYDEVFRRYKFEKGNLYEHLGIVSTNDHEGLYSVSRIMHKTNSRVHWIPTFEQYLKLYAEKEDLIFESLLPTSFHKLFP